MKENFFTRIKDGIKNAVSFGDDNDYYDDEEFDDDDDLMEDEPVMPEPPKYNSSADFHTPDYTPYGAQFTPAQPPKPAPAPKAKASKKNSANIYAMPDMKKSNKLKVSLFVLTDTDDARNVADAMIDRNIVVICDMSKISVSEERRVLDFLDGVKYVCNSIIESISEHIYLIVPEAAELSGDFFSQVDY